MVWSTTQSALYSDLSRYYNDEKTTSELKEFEPRKFEQKILEKSSEDTAEKRAENTLENPCGTECGPPCEKCRSEPPKSALNICPKRINCPNCRYRQSTARNTLSQIFSDKDKLLIAGLILLLIKQGADNKLILALAFVLLS